VTASEERRRQWAEASRRYRERHPEVREQRAMRKRQQRARMTPEQYAAERDRIREYRAKHPAQNYITNLRANRRQQAKRREVSE
jgi:hypothetical protein